MAQIDLFALPHNDDPAYCNLRDRTSDEAAEARRFVEQLWLEFQPHADQTFVTGLAQHFHGRFWEMYLTCALLRHPPKGFSVSAPKGKITGGPDILLQSGDFRIWVEAVAVTAGDPKSPGYLQEHRLQKGKKHSAPYTIPDEKIVARYTSALRSKLKQHNAHRENGIIQDGNAAIIAVNSGALPFGWANAGIPRILQAVLPVGHLELFYDRQTGKVTDERHQYRSVILNHNNAPVRTDSFLDPAWAGISAVLHSCADANGLVALGADFQIIYNPLTAVPLWPLPGPWHDHLTIPCHDHFMATLTGTGLGIDRVPGTRNEAYKPSS